MTPHRRRLALVLATTSFLASACSLVLGLKETHVGDDEGGSGEGGFDASFDVPRGDGGPPSDARDGPPTGENCGSCVDGSTDLQTDDCHCGACGHSCFGGKCVTGRCEPVSCGINDVKALAATDSGVVFATPDAIREADALCTSSRVITLRTAGTYRVEANDRTAFWVGFDGVGWCDRASCPSFCSVNAYTGALGGKTVFVVPVGGSGIETAAAAASSCARRPLNPGGPSALIVDPAETLLYTLGGCGGAAAFAGGCVLGDGGCAKIFSFNRTFDAGYNTTDCPLIRGVVDPHDGGTLHLAYDTQNHLGAYERCVGLGENGSGTCTDPIVDHVVGIGADAFAVYIAVPDQGVLRCVGSQCTAVPATPQSATALGVGPDLLYYVTGPTNTLYRIAKPRDP